MSLYHAFSGPQHLQYSKLLWSETSLECKTSLYQTVSFSPNFVLLVSYVILTFICIKRATFICIKWTVFICIKWTLWYRQSLKYPQYIFNSKYKLNWSVEISKYSYLLVFINQPPANKLAVFYVYYIPYCLSMKYKNSAFSLKAYKINTLI